MRRLWVLPIALVIVGAIACGDASQQSAAPVGSELSADSVATSVAATVTALGQPTAAEVTPEASSTPTPTTTPPGYVGIRRPRPTAVAPTWSEWPTTEKREHGFQISLPTSWVEIDADRELLDAIDDIWGRWAIEQIGSYYIESVIDQIDAGFINFYAISLDFSVFSFEYPAAVSVVSEVVPAWISEANYLQISKAQLQLQLGAESEIHQGTVSTSAGFATTFEYSSQDELPFYDRYPERVAFKQFVWFKGDGVWILTIEALESDARRQSEMLDQIADSFQFLTN